ncbi:MAG: hypothetical protein R3C44_22105 [Chloroflexota bacterium]
MAGPWKRLKPSPKPLKPLSLDPFDLLANLVNKSLVNMEDDEGEARFTFLETIRQYAGDKLFEAGEAPAARDRHLAYYGDQVTSFGPMTSRLDEIPTLAGMGNPLLYEWSRKMRPDLENLRAALDWALVTDPELALSMALDMSSLSAYWGLSDYPIEWLQAAIAGVQSLPETTAEVTRRRNQLLLAAMTMEGNMWIGMNPPQAYETIQKVLNLARELGPEYESATAMALTMGSSAAMMTGDLDFAYDLAQEAIHLYTKLGHRAAGVSSLGIVAAKYLMDGDVETANALFDESLTLREQLDNAFIDGLAGIGLFNLALELGKVDAARAILERSEQAFARFHNDRFRIIAKSDLGHLERRQGNDDKAEAIYCQTIRVFREAGHRGAVANQLEVLAFIAIHRKEYRRAATLLGAAEVLRDVSASKMMPEEREEYERELSALRAAVSVDDLQVAWENGRGLDMDSAVEYALDTA